MYDIFLYFPLGADLSEIEKIVFEEAALIKWEGTGPNPRLNTSILFLDGLPSVGLVHCKHKPSLLPGSNIETYPSCSMAIYPTQYKRVLKLDIHTDKDHDENWDKMDPGKVRLLHKGIFQIIQKVHKRVPLLSASMNTEERGMANPYTFDGSICISPNLPPILGVHAKAIPSHSYGYFVSVEQDVKIETFLVG